MPCYLQVREIQKKCDASLAVLNISGDCDFCGSGDRIPPYWSQMAAAKQVLDSLLSTLHEEASSTDMPVEIINLHGIIDKENHTRLIDELSQSSDSDLRESM